MEIGIKSMISTERLLIKPPPGMLSASRLAIKNSNTIQDKSRYEKRSRLIIPQNRPNPARTSVCFPSEVVRKGQPKPWKRGGVLIPVDLIIGKTVLVIV